MAINNLKHQGSALISALFIMALVAIAATAMTTRLQIDIFRTRAVLTHDKLYLAAQLVNFWAMGEIAAQNKKFTRSDQAGKVLSLPIKYQHFYPSVRIKGSIYDLQARFNLNNLADKNYQFFFLKLLEKNTKLSRQLQKNITQALCNWLSSYQPGQEAALFFNYYLKQKPPYYPAQQLLTNASEFMLIKDVSSNVYQELFTYLIALPEITPINLNTAPKALLIALGNGLTQEQVTKLIGARGEEGVTDLNKLSPLLKEFNIRTEHITLESQYFLVVADVTSDDSHLTTYAVMKHSKDKNGKNIASLINESINTFG